MAWEDVGIGRRENEYDTWGPLASKGLESSFIDSLLIYPQFMNLFIF